MENLIKVGSRKSQLAMWQTEYVIKILKEKNPEYDFEIVPISTKGDKLLDVALSKIGDKGLFTKELEVALLEKKIDLAVHSMKDVPTMLPEGLTISAITKRHDPRDVLIAKDDISFNDLPKGAKVGTSSLRRKSQILNKRPDLNIEDLRGNLNTRFKKMEDENFDAIIVAAAGVERLGWQDKITEKLDTDISLPAVAQGALGIETRENDERIINVLKTINDTETELCVLSERALLRSLEGGCQIPIGAHAIIDDEELFLEGMVASLDGKVMIKDRITGPKNHANELGEKLADKLKEKGALDILEQIR